MGYLFVTDRLVDSSIAVVDSTLMKAKGPLWHKSSMKKGVVPRPGIDTDARWVIVVQRDGYLDTNYI